MEYDQEGEGHRGSEVDHGQGLEGHDTRRVHELGTETDSQGHGHSRPNVVSERQEGGHASEAGGDHERQQGEGVEVNGYPREDHTSQPVVRALLPGAWLQCDESGRFALRVHNQPYHWQVIISQCLIPSEDTAFLSPAHKSQRAAQVLAARQRERTDGRMDHSPQTGEAVTLTPHQQYRELVEWMISFHWEPDYGRLLRLRKVLKRRIEIGEYYHEDE